MWRGKEEGSIKIKFSGTAGSALASVDDKLGSTTDAIFQDSMGRANMCRVVGYFWGGQDFLQSKKTVIQPCALWLFDWKGKTPFIYRSILCYKGKKAGQWEAKKKKLARMVLFCLLRNSKQGNNLPNEKIHLKV